MATVFFLGLLAVVRIVAMVVAKMENAYPWNRISRSDWAIGQGFYFGSDQRKYMALRYFRFK